MEYLHVYDIVIDIEGGEIHPKELKHVKAPIIKTTSTGYHFEIDGEIQRIAKNRLNSVLQPAGTRVILKTPDNELARSLFVEYIDDFIQQREQDITVYRQAKQLVEAFKD